MNQETLLEQFVRFKTEPSVGTRAELTEIICEQFNSGHFRPQEKDIVKEILGFLARDVEKKIRAAVSHTLKENDDLPHEIAIRLARDVEEVSTPILEFSKVLTDDDLEEIIKSSEEATKLTAIARRKTVSERISSHLVNTGKEEVVRTVVSNDNAKMSEVTMNRIVDTFKESDNIMGTLIKRGGLSTTLAEKMVTMVSAKLQRQIATEYKINHEAVRTTVGTAQEKVVLGVISENADKNGTINLVNQLFRTGKLSHSIVLRALCRADLDFFEAGIAKLAGIPASNAKKLVRAGDKKGFAALFNAASMPSTMKDAAEALLLLIMESDRKENENEALYSRRLIERIVSRGYDRDVPNMQYFMTLIGSSAGDNKRQALH